MCTGWCGSNSLIILSIERRAPKNFRILKICSVQTPTVWWFQIGKAKVPTTPKSLNFSRKARSPKLWIIRPRSWSTGQSKRASTVPSKWLTAQNCTLESTSNFLIKLFLLIADTVAAYSTACRIIGQPQNLTAKHSNSQRSSRRLLVWLTVFESKSRSVLLMLP